ncbi:MAG: plasmid pRiA4b ORF-3 family protein [archaeon]|nr:plasmid pRiA4b ORF-3 family protein [archaeon]
MTHYKMKVKLRNDLYRVLLVPSDMLFFDLERIIKHLFNWSGDHLSVFELPEEKAEIAHPSFVDRGNSFSYCFRSDGERLCDHRCKEIRYIYDLGDYWTHRITVEEELEGEIDRPRLIKAKGIAYLENRGGDFEGSEVSSAMFTKAELDKVNKEYFDRWVPTKARYEIERTPYNAMYSLAMAAFFPAKIHLFIDPKTGMVYSEKKSGYFPQAKSVSDLIKLGRDTRYDLQKELTSRIENEYDRRYVYCSDPATVYTVLSERQPTLVHTLVKTMKEIAKKAADSLDLVFSKELLYDRPLWYSDQPYRLALTEPVCPSCIGRLSNPRPDVNSGYRFYEGNEMHTICMTCANCGKVTRIIPFGLMDEMTYEGYRLPLKTLDTVLKASSYKDTAEEAELYRTMMMYIVGERRDAVKRAKALVLSSNLRCRAMAATVLFCEGKADIDAARKAVSVISPSLSPDWIEWAVVSAMAVKAGLEGEYCDAIEEFVTKPYPFFEFGRALSVIASILPLDHPLQGSITDMILQVATDMDSFWGWALREDYCRRMAATGRIDEISPESMLDDPDYVNREIYSMSRYRCGVLSIGKDVKTTVREFRGLLGEIYENPNRQPEQLVRASYAALVLHHLGETYSGRDLLSYSVRWVAKARENGFVDDTDLKQYLDEFFKVTVGKVPEKNLSAYLKRNKISAEIPAVAPGTFDPSVLNHIDAQYRVYPY